MPDQNRNTKVVGRGEQKTERVQHPRWSYAAIIRPLRLRYVATMYCTRLKRKVGDGDCRRRRGRTDGWEGWRYISITGPRWKMRLGTFFFFFFFFSWLTPRTGKPIVTRGDPFCFREYSRRFPDAFTDVSDGAITPGLHYLSRKKAAKLQYTGATWGAEKKSMNGH